MSFRVGDRVRVLPHKETCPEWHGMLGEVREVGVDGVVSLLVGPKTTNPLYKKLGFDPEATISFGPRTAHYSLEKIE